MRCKLYRTIWRVAWQVFLLAAVLPAAGAPMAEHLLFQAMTEGNNRPLPTDGSCRWQGWIHANGEGVVTPGGGPVYCGRYTQSGSTVNGLTEPQYPQVFQGGYQLDYDELDWYPWLLIAPILEQVPVGQVFPAQDSLGRPVTTSLRFHEGFIDVTRYLPELAQPGDTLFQMEHDSLAYPEIPLLWIQGVARVEGVVGQSLTVIASDTLFITGDLIVPGTNITDCDDPDSFGMAPMPSQVQVGLIGEKDVIIAATLENGLGNLPPDAPTCGYELSPVVESCGQGRRDVIITAAILAADCSFLAEFWQTTAYGATLPDEPYPIECSDNQNRHNRILPCEGADPLEDDRGTLWFCGSMSFTGFGHFRQYEVGPWAATIGYMGLQMRHDPNFLDQAPPFWPEATWIDEDPVEITLSGTAQAWCGVPMPSGTLASLLELQEISVSLVWYGETVEPVRITTWFDGVAVDVTRDTLADGEHMLFVPDSWVPVPEPARMHISVEWDAQAWNLHGESCLWETTGAGQEEPTIQPSTLAMYIAPNPANPTFTIDYEVPVAGDTTLELYDLRGRKVQTLVSGPRPSGSHRQVVDPGSGASGLYFVRLVTPAGQRVEKVLVLR